MKLLQDKTNVDAPDATWPFGDLNDNSGSNDGTPVNKELLTDVLQLMEKLIDEAGITANGLPDNDVNGWQLFEALQSASKKYWVYTALLSQTGTNAPTVESIDADGNANSPLENSLSGAIVWSYSSVGSYIGTLAAAFVDKKTFLIIRNESNTIMSIERFDAGNVLINTRDNTGTLTNGLLTQTSVEIRVYR